MSTELLEDTNLLGKKKEREKEPNFFNKEEAFNNFQYKNKYVNRDIELIKSYSNNLFMRLKQSPVEIINVIISPYTKLDKSFILTYNIFLQKIIEIPLNSKKIIKYMYNNGIIHEEPITLPCDLKQEQQIINLDNMNNDNVIEEEIDPNFISVNSWEISKSLKEYKWTGLIKIIIFYGDNGFINQVIKNIDCYHYNIMIINLKKITAKEKSNFNNIINNIYSFKDIISFLKQDIYEYSKGKNDVKEISEHFKEYNDILIRYSNYDLNLNNENNNNSIDTNYLIVNFFHKNNIKINKNEYALFDTNSSAKTYIGKCFTSKIKKNWKNGIVNLINPEKILNEIEVELSISNNIYTIVNGDGDINFHINDLTLGKKMVGITKNKIEKKNFIPDYFENNILLNYAICDYICDLFNIKLLGKEINLNLTEIHFYICSNYNVPYIIAKEFPKSYKKKYNKELYECFSHFSYCISQGKILIENIDEYDGKIYSFDIFKDNDDFDNDEKINIFRFFCYHKCNKYCELLKLNSVDTNFFDFNEFLKNKRICDICKVIFNINNCDYDFEKDDLCLCSNCYKKIYESKYERVCTKCGKKFNYFYLFYILQKKEIPSECEECKNKPDNEDNNVSNII